MAEEQGRKARELLILEREQYEYDTEDAKDVVFKLAEVGRFEDAIEVLTEWRFKTNYFRTLEVKVSRGEELTRARIKESNEDGRE